MASLAEHICNCLAENETGTATTDEIQEYIDSYEPPKPKVSKKKAPKEDEPPAAKTKKVSKKEEAPKKVAKKASPKSKKTEDADEEAVPVKKASPKSKTSKNDAVKKTSPKPKAPKNEEDTDVDEEPKVKKTSKKDAKGHTCEYTIKGKDGPRICGKPAKNEVEGMWVCGTENNGHYKSALGASEKVKAKSKGKDSPKPKVVPKGKGKVITQKFSKNSKIQVHETATGSGIFIELETRICFDKKNPKEAYGILDEDNETILPLTQEAIDFLEAHNLQAKKTKASAKAKTGKKSQKDEEDADAEADVGEENEPDEEEADAEAEADPEEDVDEEGGVEGEEEPDPEEDADVDLEEGGEEADIEEEDEGEAVDPDEGGEEDDEE
jgi:hypothetical protein